MHRALYFFSLAKGVEAGETVVSDVKLESGGGNNVFVFEYYYVERRHFKILFHYQFSFHHLAIS